MAYRCAIIDDYQNVALKLADWSKVTKDVEIKVFTEAVRRSAPGVLGVPVEVPEHGEYVALGAARQAAWVA